MKKHTLTLLGGRSNELRVPADVLVETVSALLEGARAATRFLVEGESVRKGTRPAWLEAVCRFDIVGLTAGSAEFAVQAPALEDAAPEFFAGYRQVPLFVDPHRVIDGRDSVVDVFGRVLASALQGDAERVLADRTLLDACVRFARAARDGFDAIQLDGVAGLAEPLIVRNTAVPKIESLRNQTPGAKAVRLTGKLETISASKSDVVLLVRGVSVPGRLEDRDTETLRALFGTRVVVSGLAQYRPSGKLLVVDIEHVGPAREQDALFETLPTASARPSQILVPQDETTGVSAFFGTWPGDETDADLAVALEAIR